MYICMPIPKVTTEGFKEDQYNIKYKSKQNLFKIYFNSVEDGKIVNIKKNTRGKKSEKNHTFKP